MIKVRKKPMVIEVEQFSEDGPLPRGVTPGITFPNGERMGAYVITAHKQRVYLKDGDWIFPEPDGEHFYPVKDEVFRSTYQVVEE